MNRKVFISLLWLANYSSCFYTRIDKEFKSKEVRYIQEATLDYLTKTEEWNSSDVAYILLTHGAEKKNWVDNGHVRPETNLPIEQSGLKTQLERMKLPFPVIPIKNLPDGNDEKEIWMIFEQVFKLLQENDELYFDLTHGFRYLPMLILVLGNYSKFLKNIVVKSITYGNYEARNRERNEAAIIDLHPLSDLQDWTFASANFLKNGNITQLKNLCDQNLKPILKEAKGSNLAATTLKKYMAALERVVNDMNTCRGINIIQGNNINELFYLSSQLTDVIIEPLKPVIEKMRDSFTEFMPSPNIKNGYLAAKWCFDNQLYQQALTILHETIISHICESEKWDNIHHRELVSKALNIYINKTGQEGWQCSPDQVGLIKEILSNKALAFLASTYKVTTSLRNDYNHAGMRSNPANRQRLISQLKERIDTISLILDKLCS